MLSKIGLGNFWGRFRVKIGKSNLLCGNAAVFIYFKVGGGVARGVAVYSGVIAYAVINAAAAGGRNSKA